MRYLLNYKGTTLPFQADRVKNWLLSSSLRFFFSIPPSRKVMYNNVAREEYISPIYRSALHPQSPSPYKGQTCTGQTGKPVTSFQRGRDFLIAVWLCGHAMVYEQTWHTHTNIHRHKEGRSAAAARGARSSINLHPAEICEAGRLRGGR